MTKYRKTTIIYIEIKTCLNTIIKDADAGIEAYINTLGHLVPGDFMRIQARMDIPPSELLGPAASTIERACGLVRWLITKNNGDCRGLKTVLSAQIPDLRGLEQLPDAIDTSGWKNRVEAITTVKLPPNAEAYINILKKLLLSDFAQIEMLMNIHEDSLPGRSAPMAERAHALVSWLIANNNGDFSKLKAFLVKTTPGLNPHQIVERIAHE